MRGTKVSYIYSFKCSGRHVLKSKKASGEFYFNNYLLDFLNLLFQNATSIKKLIDISHILYCFCNMVIYTNSVSHSILAMFQMFNTTVISDHHVGQPGLDE